MARRICSFCAKPEDQVAHLLAGHRDVAICDECARLAVEITGEHAFEQTSGDLLLTGIGLMITNDPRQKGPIEGGAIAVRGGNITWIGPERELPSRYRSLITLDCGGRTVLPGFVDSHTHLVYDGDRAEEFGRRMRGEDYESIMAAGGGIQATVAATRAAGPDRLLDLALERADRMLSLGTTTVEIKSGYGLDTLTERHMLEVAGEIGRRLPIDVVSTFLGAHAVPEEYRRDRDAYLWLIEEEMLPAVAPVAAYCDVFCDAGVFSVDEARRVLAAGRRHGLRPRLHANQLGDTGGLELAVEIGAISADHLEHVTVRQASLLADAGVVAVLLPAASLSMRSKQAPARLLRDAGAIIALATDCNPGTSNVESMQFVVALGALEMGLTVEESIWAATRGGALAVEEPDKGWLRVGAVADLHVLDTDNYIDIAYHPDRSATWKVIKDGRVVVG
ncbi:MAG TPA: imidazolonepropionase [Acidimicrobiia bacterium]|nr:imidazolonepropionase [Acidimicrobiia bacterium]